MIIDDIVELERSLSLKCPKEYVALVCSKEMRLKYEDTELGHGLLFDKALIEAENLDYRNLPVVCEYWDSSWLAIHRDGGGNVYFITTDPFDEKVYDFDHEQTFSGYQPTESPAFASIKDFLAHLDVEMSWDKDSLKRESRTSLFKRVFKWLVVKLVKS